MVCHWILPSWIVGSLGRHGFLCTRRLSYWKTIETWGLLEPAFEMSLLWEETVKHGKAVLIENKLIVMVSQKQPRSWHGNSTSHPRNKKTSIHLMHPGISYWSRSTVVPCDNSTSILSMFPRIGSMITIIGRPSAGNVRNKTWILPFLQHFCQIDIWIKAVLSLNCLGLALLWGAHVERQKGSHSVRDETWNIWNCVYFQSLPDHGP